MKRVDMTMKGSMVLIPAVVEPAREDIWSTTDNPSMDWGKGTCRNDDFSWVWFCECKRVSLLQRECTKAFRADVSTSAIDFESVQQERVIYDRAKNLAPGGLVIADARGGWRRCMNRASTSLPTRKKGMQTQTAPQGPRRLGSPLAPTGHSHHACFLCGLPAAPAYLFLRR